MPTTLWQADMPNEETQLRYPSLNPNNPYLVPPPHPTPSLTPLLVAPLLLPAAHQASSLSTRDLPGLLTSTRIRNLHLSVMGQNKVSRLTTAVTVCRPHPFQPGVYLKSTGKFVCLLQHVKTHTWSWQPTLLHTVEALLQLIQDPTEMAKPAERSAW